MSMTIIGGDDKKITIITNRKIINSLDDIERKYDFYKNKYEIDISNNIISKNNKHYILQLCDTFGHKDINSLLKELNYINNSTTLYHYIRYLLNKYDYINKLKNTIKRVKSKLNLPFKNSLYEDINDIKQISYEIDIDNKLKIINEQVVFLKSISTPTYKNINLMDNWGESTIFVKELIESIEHILFLNNLVKNNITTIYTAINDITDIFTNSYL